MGFVYLMRWVSIVIQNISRKLEIRMSNFETNPKSECLNFVI
jgi:hypothetical protein